MKYVFPEYKENVVLGNGKLQLNPMSYLVIYEGKEIDLTPSLALKPVGIKLQIPWVSGLSPFLLR